MAQRSTHEATLVSAINGGKFRSTHEALLASAIVSSGKLRSTHEAILISVTAPITMSLSYPLTPPTALGPQEVKFRLVSVVGETASPFSGSQQEQQWPAQWWEIEVTLPPMKRAISLAQRNADKRFTAELWASMLAALGGRFGTFLMGDPNGVAPQGVATGTPVTAGTSAVAPNNVITTSGWIPGVTGILLAGDYIQVTPTGGSQRLYKLLLDANSDGAGNSSLTVAPMLHESLSSGLSIVTANPRGTFRLDENKAEWDVKQARTYGISFKAKEAI
ncbi:MAG TPA: hypothetical protein VGM18_04850 [Candidatus Sulfotelmatobacter sp.]|jgi:hypothetical protein